VGREEYALFPRRQRLPLLRSLRKTALSRALFQRESNVHAPAPQVAIIYVLMAFYYVQNAQRGFAQYVEVVGLI
jgi:hypothetical protein